MKITWILNDIEISGGVKAVFCLSNELSKRGHEVSILYPLIPLGITPKKLLTKGYKAIPILLKRRGSRGSEKLWFDLDSRVKMVQVPMLINRYVPDADVVLATWWETAYVVKRLSPSKGRKFYFIQHYEVWGGPKEKVDQSYRLGLTNIVNSEWTKCKVEGVGGKVTAKILHAPMWEQFPEVEMPGHKGIRVLMPSKSSGWKGTDDGRRAFYLAKKQCPKLRLVLFGWSDGYLSPLEEFHQTPVGEDLNRLYQSCDIFLSPSKEEGFGMPNMEASVCGLPVVTTNVGAVPEYSQNGKTMLASESGDVNALAENLVRLAKDEELRKRLGRESHEYIKRFRWEKSAIELERVLEIEKLLGYIEENT